MILKGCRQISVYQKEDYQTVKGTLISIVFWCFRLQEWRGSG
jgi:hypothetical protein